MGKVANCPNCQSPFQAGKSVAEAEVPMKQPHKAPSALQSRPMDSASPIECLPANYW